MLYEVITGIEGRDWGADLQVRGPCSLGLMRRLGKGDKRRIRPVLEPRLRRKSVRVDGPMESRPGGRDARSVVRRRRRRGEVGAETVDRPFHHPFHAGGHCPEVIGGAGVQPLKRVVDRHRRSTRGQGLVVRNGDRITSYNVCYTKLLRHLQEVAMEV